MLHERSSKIGNFAKKGEDFKDKDLLTILSEGQVIQPPAGSKYNKPQIVFKVKLPNGEEKNTSFNKTSIDNCIDAWGKDDAKWINKQVKVWETLQNIEGKMKKVYYFSHPDAVIDEEGHFYLEGKQTSPEQDIPVIEDGNEINVKDIPF